MAAFNHFARAVVTLEQEKRELLKIAEQLCYKEDVLRKLANAKSKSELSNIMATARAKM